MSCLRGCRTVKSATLLSSQCSSALDHPAIDVIAGDYRTARWPHRSLSVSLLLAEIGGIADAEILSAAMLHDTLEDTDSTPKELEAAVATGHPPSLRACVLNAERLPQAPGLPLFCNLPSPNQYVA
jgi:hypothetical protein